MKCDICRTSVLLSLVLCCCCRAQPPPLFTPCCSASWMSRIPVMDFSFLFFFIAGRHNRQRWLRRDNINVFAGFLGTLRLIVVDCLKKRKLWWKVEDSLGTFSDTSKKGTVCSLKALEQSLSTPLVHIVLYEIFVFIREYGCHRGHIFMYMVIRDTLMCSGVSGR